MKLEVGMYVKTINGFHKISRINFKGTNWESYDCDLKENGNGGVVYIPVVKREIINASHNIMDLIEEKDLLEIEYFSLRYEKRVTRLFEVTFKDGNYTNLDNAKCTFMLIDNDWSNSDKELEPIIKSIVTKEQFESMSYKVGE